ncbi:MAG TPA: ATP-binding protein [Methylibium sp.]
MLTNERTAIEAARQAVLAYLAPWALGPQAAYRVELVLEETLMNIVWHAFPKGGVHPVELTVRVEGDAIELRFENDGIEFDPTTALQPTLPERIEDAHVGGLGLMLVRRCARSLDYRRESGRNRLTVVVAAA